MTPTQCRMARAGLQLSIVQLAEMADSNRTSIVNFERGRACHPVTQAKLRRALEATGRIRFVRFHGVAGVHITENA